MLDIAIVVAASALWLAVGLVYGEVLIRRDKAGVMAPAAYSPDEERVACILAFMLWPVYAVIDIVVAVRAGRTHLARAGRRAPALRDGLDRPGHPTQG